MRSLRDRVGSAFAWAILIPLFFFALAFQPGSEWPKRIYWAMAFMTVVVFTIIWTTGAVS